MKLVSDWKKTWSYYSTQAMAAAGATQVAWVSLPTDLRASIPGEWVTYGTAAVLVLGIIGRLVKQDTE